MNKKRPHLDYARTHRQLDDNFATVPEMTIISMLPAKIFDKGPSLAVALGLCVGLSFGVGILSGWYSYRTTDAHAQALCLKTICKKIASATEAHRVRTAPSALTFLMSYGNLRKKSKCNLKSRRPQSIWWLH